MYHFTPSDQDPGHGRSRGQARGRKRCRKSLRTMAPSSYVSFRNCTSRIAEVLWLPGDGDRVSYTEDGIRPRQQLDVDTFGGCPWIIRDHVSGDKLVFTVNASPESPEVFLPIVKAEDISSRDRPTQVNIHIPVYTLKERSLQVIRRVIKKISDFNKLDLPAQLRTELANPEDILDVVTKDLPYISWDEVNNRNV